MEMAAGVQPLTQHKPLVVNVRNLYSAIIALIPVIMIINIPIVNMGASTVSLILLVPYALLRIKPGKKAVSLLPFLMLFGYLLYRSAGSFADQFLLVIVLIHVYGAINGSVNIRVVRKTLEVVAVVAASCVVLQSLLYYGLGIRTFFLIKALVLEENHDYFRSYLVGMYRPCAFFLEPSHYTQYCCLGMLSSLFPADGQKGNIKKALWIALGCLLTSSGMGIFLCAGVFGWYVLFSRRKKGAKLLSLIGWSLAALAVLAVLMQFSFFSQAVQRVFGEVDGYNALWGRTLYWDSYIGSLSGTDAIVGMGLANMPEIYMTGLMKVIYCYGYVGAGLMLLAILHLFIRSRNIMARCICVIYCGLMCIANLFSFLSLSFWLPIIIALSVTARMESKDN